MTTLVLHPNCGNVDDDIGDVVQLRKDDDDDNARDGHLY